MKLAIKSFADPGSIDQERIAISVLGDVDVGSFAIFRAKRNSTGDVSAGYKVAYWFPDKQVKAGDLVILYTKKGKSREKQLDGDRTAHFFYWGLSDPAWAPNSGNAAVLLSVAEWKTKDPDA